MEESQKLTVPKGYQIQSFLRIASISVALYDYLETYPTAWKFYKEQWHSRRLTVSAALFVLIRFSSIVVLSLSSIGFFYDNFDKKLCEKFFLLPPIMKVIQIMVSQAILGMRVYNLSKRSDKVLYIGLFVYFVTCSLQWVTTLLQREALVGTDIRNCRAFNRKGELGAWIFYAIAMAYDVTTTSTSVFYLLRYKTSTTTGSVVGKLTSMMLYDGLGYLVALTAINILNLILYKTSTDIQSAAASLGYCLTWIMSQRILIHLHGLIIPSFSAACHQELTSGFTKDASRERRMESEVFTISQDVLSPRDVSEVVRAHFAHKQPPLPFRHQLRRSDLERTFDELNSEDFDVQVRVERTVKVERRPRTIQLEDYSRRGRQEMRNIQTRH